MSPVVHQFHVADDHPLFRNAMTDVIKIHFPEASITHSSTLEETIETMQQGHEIDLLFLDLNMPGSEDLFGLIALRRQFPETPVVVVSAWQDNQTISRAMHHGASGFIPKSLSTEAIIDATKKILAGAQWTPLDKTQIESFQPDESEMEVAEKLAQLTTQQHKVLRALKEGKLNKQIAFDLGVAEATVKAHISSIFKKLGVSNRTQAVVALNKIASTLN